MHIDIDNIEEIAPMVELFFYITKHLKADGCKQVKTVTEMVLTMTRNQTMNQELKKRKNYSSH